MKTALDYAQESMEFYCSRSILNPHNRNGPIIEQDRLEWEKIYNDQKIITYLETILERLPYNTKVEK